MAKRLNVKIKKGFTLLEVIIAIFLITFGIAVSLLLVTRTIGQMTVSSSRLIAICLSQEGIEIVRNIRDTNWIEQSSNPANPWDEGLNTAESQAGCEADYITGSATDTNPLDPTLPLYGSGRPLCLDADGFYKYIDATCTGATQTKFKRKITITPDGSDILKVKVDVSWTEKGKTTTVSAQENLYNWH